MRRRASLFAGASTFTIGLAFQVLGFQSTIVGLALMTLGGIFILLWAAPVLTRLRLRLTPTVGSINDEQFTRTQTVDFANLWPSARAFLRSEPRSQLLIYAPTGVWERSDGKRPWFGTIATCLLNADPSARNQLLASDSDPDAKYPLQAFKGVFGLPRKPTPNDAADKDRFRNELATAEQLLVPLNGIATAHLRYLSTDVETIPGTGIIVIDQSNVAYALAVDGRYLVDYVVFLLDVPDIGAKTSNWFHDYTMKVAASNILQDMSVGIDLHAGFDTIRRKYGV